jgi:hypothetical protein
MYGSVPYSVPCSVPDELVKALNPEGSYGCSSWQRECASPDVLFFNQERQTPLAPHSLSERCALSVPPPLTLTAPTIGVPKVTKTQKMSNCFGVTSKHTHDNFLCDSGQAHFLLSSWARVQFHCLPGSCESHSPANSNVQLSLVVLAVIPGLGR